jgi:hypothetical protein
MKIEIYSVLTSNIERRGKYMDQKNSQFTRVLSRFDVLFLAIGAMLGWGWVVLSAPGLPLPVR